MTENDKLNYAILATDVIVFRLYKGELQTVLVKTKHDKFPGRFAFPGGLVSLDEKLEDASLRFYSSVIKPTRRKPHLEQLYTFGDPKRDPSGRVVSVAYFALVSSETEINQSQDEFPLIDWFPFYKLPPLAYDHVLVAKEALARLRSKLSYTNLMYALMPKEFTLTQLQTSYETILGEPLDKRNFRKKIKSLDLLRELPRQSRGAAHRPAQLYSFTSIKPQVIPVL